MNNIKSGIAAELYDRQLELLKVNAKRYYNQDSLTYDVDDYIFVDQNEALEEAINNAGIFNFPKFGGSGDIKFAIETLCKIFNIKKYQIVEMFG